MKTYNYISTNTIRTNITQRTHLNYKNCTHGSWKVACKWLIQWLHILPVTLCGSSVTTKQKVRSKSESLHIKCQYFHFEQTRCMSTLTDSNVTDEHSSSACILTCLVWVTLMTSELLGKMYTVIVLTLYFNNTHSREWVSQSRVDRNTRRNFKATSTSSIFLFLTFTKGSKRCCIFKMYLQSSTDSSLSYEVMVICKLSLEEKLDSGSMGFLCMIFFWKTRKFKTFYRTIKAFSRVLLQIRNIEILTCFGGSC